jgi:hypothetical protein
MIELNSELAMAFPTVVRKDALAAVSALPESSYSRDTFSVRVAGEEVSIPKRIHHDPLGISIGFRLGLRSELEREMLDCLFTRHTDGFVRQNYLERILRSNNDWIPAFVIRLAGEYVIEILQDIERALPHLDRAVYGDFVWNNPAFVQKTKQRIASYWDCYYRSVSQELYPGFRILSFLEELEKGPACAGPAKS